METEKNTFNRQKVQQKHLNPSQVAVGNADYVIFQLSY